MTWPDVAYYAVTFTVACWLAWLLTEKEDE